MRLATINGLPGVIVDGPEAAFEIEGDVVRAMYVVRNSEKLRHLAAAPPTSAVPDERSLEQRSSHEPGAPISSTWWCLYL